MGLFDKFKKQRTEEQPTQKQNITKDDYDYSSDYSSLSNSKQPNIDVSVQKFIEEINEEDRRIEKEINDQSTYMEGVVQALNNAPGARHLDDAVAEQAKDFLKELEKNKQKEIRESYLSGNRYAYIVNELLAYLSREELMKKLGFKDSPEYSGYEDCIAAIYNYKLIQEPASEIKCDLLQDVRRVRNRAPLDIKKEYIFIPYLATLENLGTKYGGAISLPENIVQIYEEYKNDDEFEKRDKLALARGILSEMGMDIDIYMQAKEFGEYEKYFFYSGPEWPFIADNVKIDSDLKNKFKSIDRAEKAKNSTFSPDSAIRNAITSGTTQEDVAKSENMEKITRNKENKGVTKDD